MILSRKSRYRKFLLCEDGASTVSFVLIFPVFMILFLMTVEAGMISLQRVMLDGAVERVTRDLRVSVIKQAPGQTDADFKREIRDRICAEAGIINDCQSQTEIETIRNSPVAWTTISQQVACVDRGDLSNSSTAYTNGNVNDVLILKVCTRIDPFLPLTGIGRAVRVANNDSSAGGSYAITSISAYVVEPL